MKASLTRTSFAELPRVQFVYNVKAQVSCNKYSKTTIEKEDEE
jgi:hypothetical protein